MSKVSMNFEVEFLLTIIICLSLRRDQSAYRQEILGVKYIVSP